MGQRSIGGDGAAVRGTLSLRQDAQTGDRGWRRDTIGHHPRVVHPGPHHLSQPGIDLVKLPGMVKDQ
jgi:hypothetical protein